MSHRTGMVLIVVLVTVALVSLALYGFADRMLVEQQAARYATQQAQTRQMLDSGAAALQVMLVDTPDVIAANGGLYENPGRFANQTLTQTASGADPVYVSILSPAMQPTGDYAGFRFGLLDESAKLNINTFLKRVTQAQQQEEALLRLPGMTLPVAHSILDWLDSDSEPRSSGAEADYYQALPQPYTPRNGPIASLEELLLVQGVTPELLFGVDQNRDGVVGSDEAQGNSVPTTDSSLLFNALGWSAYLTTWSAENSVSSLGTPRIDVNGSDLQQLQTDLQGVLDADWATFILAYRLGQDYTGAEQGEPVNGRTVELPASTGGTTGGATGAGTAGAGGTSASSGRKIGSLLQLIGVRVQVRLSGQTQTTVLKSPFSDAPADMASYVPQLFDAITTDSGTVAGRININQAPYPVLATLTQLQDDQIVAILGQRQLDPTLAGEPLFPTWLVEQNILTLEELKAIYPFITTGGDVYRAQLVAYQTSGVESRAEVVVDATQAIPRVVMWKETTTLGGRLGATLLPNMGLSQPTP